MSEPKVAIGVIGQNVVIDYGSHDAAMLAVDHVAAALARADAGLDGDLAEALRVYVEEWGDDALGGADVDELADWLAWHLHGRPADWPDLAVRLQGEQE